MQNYLTQSGRVLAQSSDAGAVYITLNRPEIHNAFDAQVISELLNIFNKISADDQVKACVLQAKGKTFSAGADFNWMQTMAALSEEENRQDANVLANMMRALDTLPVPTIAKVQGAAYGGALGLISCCDIAIASDRAKFCTSEVKIGLIPAVISPYVVRALGYRAARRYMVSAETFSADQGLALGFLHHVCDASELDDAVEETLNKLAKNGPQAMAACKTLIENISNRPINQEVMGYTSEQIAKIRVSPEGQEGLAAFLQKRTPNWITNQDD